MVEIKRRVNSVIDRKKWAARGASFVAKLKATKVVWFPPEPVEAGQKAAAVAKDSAEQATKKMTSAGENTTSGARTSGG